MLAKSHSEPSKKNRKAKKLPVWASSLGLSPTFTEKYAKADRIIDEIYKDIANGVSRSTVIKKLEVGGYAAQENEGMKNRVCHTYYNAAMDRFAVDCDIEADKLRKLLWGRYEKVFEEAVKKGDNYNARGCLDSMARIFLGIDEKKNKASIEIKNNDSGIKVTFGYNSDKDEDEKIEDAEYEEV